MIVPPEFRNLLVYLLQVALLIALGGLLRLAFRIRLPRVLLIYWQVLLVVSLALPLAAPRRTYTVPDPDALSLDQSVDVAAPAPLQTPPSVTRTDWIALFWRGLFPIFSLICVVRLGRLAVGMIRLRFLRRRARRLEWPEPGFECIATLRVNSEVFISSDIPGPATYGFVRSTVLLPQQFESMDPGTQLSILSHEFIHVRRHDWLFGLAEQLIAAFFWFHPAVSWLVHHIELAREQLVDREVLKLSVDRRQYLRSLLVTAGGREALLSANLFLARHHLKERIAVILEEVHMSKKRLVASLISAVLLFVLGAAVSMYALPLTQTVVQNPQTPAPKPVVTPPVPGVAPPVSVAAHPVSTIAPPVPAAAPPAPIKVGKPPKPLAQAGQAKVVPIAPPPVPEPNKTADIQKRIAGVVIDPDGGFLPEVNIRVTDPDTNDVVATGVTSDQGTFSLSLASTKESFDFTFSQEGFRQSEIKGVRVAGNTPTSIRVTMQLASATVMLNIRPGEEIAGAFVSPTNVSGRAFPAALYWEKNIAYPTGALQQGAEATVIAEVIVEADGMISAVRMIKSDPLFDETVMNAVRQWRCRPAYLNGKPHQSTNTVTVVFKK